MMEVKEKRARIYIPVILILVLLLGGICWCIDHFRADTAYREDGYLAFLTRTLGRVSQVLLNVCIQDIGRMILFK